jgi:hypothetical protein
MSGTRTGFFDSLIIAARENPLSAALIGGGAVWLLVGDEKLKGVARSAAAVASDVVDSGAGNLRAAATGLQRTVAPPTAPEMDHERGVGRGDTLRAASRAATGSMSDAADEVRDRFAEGFAFAREQFGSLGNSLPAKESVTKVQSSLSDLLERQPLVLGAVGLAIGAAVAGAFRTSQIENELVGEISDDVKDDLSSRGTAVSKALREASDMLVSEASDTGAEAVDRVKQAGMDAAQAAKEEMKST